MSFAFAWLGPWGAMSYKVYESLLGLSHSAAKAIHFGLQSGAVVVLCFPQHIDARVLERPHCHAGGTKAMVAMVACARALSGEIGLLIIIGLLLGLAGTTQLLLAPYQRIIIIVRILFCHGACLCYSHGARLCYSHGARHTHSR